MWQARVEIVKSVLWCFEGVLSPSSVVNMNEPMLNAQWRIKAVLFCETFMLPIFKNLPAVTAWISKHWSQGKEKDMLRAKRPLLYSIKQQALPAFYVFKWKDKRTTARKINTSMIKESQCEFFWDKIFTSWISNLWNYILNSLIVAYLTVTATVTQSPAVSHPVIIVFFLFQI